MPWKPTTPTFLWQTRLNNSLKEKERLLRSFTERMLTRVVAKYDKDSEQYQKAGGTKKSDRKRRKRKTALVAA